MKRIIALLLALVLAMSLLASCGNASDGGAKEDSKKAEEPAKEDEAEPEAEDDGEEAEPAADGDIITDFGGQKITVVMYGGNPEQAGVERVVFLHGVFHHCVFPLFMVRAFSSFIASVSGSPVMKD